MNPALIATLLINLASSKATPTLSLELGRVPSGGTGARLLVVRFRASGSTDGYFSHDAVRLDIRDSRRDRIPYMCKESRSLSPDYTRLRPGKTKSEWLELSCYPLERGKNYTVTAVFDDGDNDLRGEAPSGPVWITGPLRSNSIAMHAGELHDKALQPAGASRRR
jgi:hypothetical protein